MLTISDLTYRVGGRTLMEKTSLSIGAGQRVGLVGPNGVGKSTLFKLITGELVADSGDINLIKNTRVGWVKQDLPEDDTRLIDVVLAADATPRHDAPTRRRKGGVDMFGAGFGFVHWSAPTTAR